MKKGLACIVFIFIFNDIISAVLILLMFNNCFVCEKRTRMQTPQIHVYVTAHALIMTAQNQYYQPQVEKHIWRLVIQAKSFITCILIAFYWDNCLIGTLFEYKKVEWPLV